MNKNWLYRILAIALVAMLALPVFAMAEEFEEVEVILGNDGVVEEAADVEENLVIDVEEDNPDDYFEVDFDEKTWDAGKFYLAGEEATDGFIIGVDIGDYDGVASLSFKSNKSKVATASQYGSYYGLVTFQGTGKATVTVKAKLYKEGHNSLKYKTKSTKVTFEVIDPYAVDSVKTYFGTYDSYDDDDTEKSGHKYDAVDMGIPTDDGEEKVLLPIGVDAGGDVCSYISTEDGDYAKTWKWTWSNAKVAFFKPGVNATKKEQKSGYWYEDYTSVDGEALVPVFYKPGTTTVTFKNGTKKGTAKFTVKKKTRSWTVSKKNNGVSGQMVLVVKKATFKDYDHAEVTVVAYNDSGAKFKKGKHEITIGQKTGSDTEPVFTGTVNFDKDVADGKTVQFTLKFTNKRDDSFEITDEQIVMPDVDLSKGKLEITEIDWEPASADPAWGNEAAID